VADVTATRSPALPDDAVKPRAVEDMFDRIAPRYDLLNRLLTFRMDVGWRRHTVRALELTPGARVLDLACGTGDLCRELQRGGLQPIGVDFSAGMLQAARTNAPLVRADALRLPVADGTVDGITCGFALRNFAALPPFLAECARVLRPDGRFAFLDVAEPASPSLRWVHGVWFRKVVPFVGGLLSDRRAYAYLPASTAYLPPTAELVSLVAHHGFEQVSRRTFGAGAAQLITGTRA
jgi:demethylmenaquinone methyltransferase/2-methoxy-6-polyprenyl-1,4-benzoquinol methylase